MQTSEALERSSPLYERVYKAVKDLIVSGRLRPGEPLSEVQLADMLKVSRTPVREAVRQLVSENLLVMPPRGGIRVYAPTTADLADVYYTRAFLEGAAAHLATVRTDDSFVAELAAICERCRPAVERGDAETAALLNTEFHWAIVRRAGNARIENLLASLDPTVIRYRRISLMFHEHMARSWDDHLEIVQRLKQGDPAAVENLVREHIFRAGGRIVRAMQQIDGLSDAPPSPTMELILRF